jgi:hypothetical protein
MNRNQIIGSGLSVVLALGAARLEYENSPECHANGSVFGKIACSIVGTEQPEQPKQTGQPNTAPEQTVLIDKDQFPRDEIFGIEYNGLPYVWPAGRPHRSLIYTGFPFTPPCAMPNCHWDGTAAVDIAYKDPQDPTAQIFPDDDYIVGEPVRAITNGVIETVREDPKAEDCYRIQFHGADDRFYWYGHLINPLVLDGQPVQAGQEIAQVGSIACNPGHLDTSYAHLHIDEGCVTAEGPQHGGGDSCRNEDLIAVLNTIYLSMPE